jgi:adenylate cyclase
MFSQSIRRKIIGIALALVVLMVATSVLSMLMASRVGHLLDELTNKYVPAYRDLARANVRSLERALVLRQMVIAKMQTPPDDAVFAERLQTYRTKNAEVAQEADAARNLALVGGVPHSLWGALAWIVGIVAVFVPLSIWRYRRLS